MAFLPDSKSAVLLLTLASACPLQAITQAEPDDSIPTANATGLVAGTSGSVVALGSNGDGAHGPAGTASGDMDFFKLTAAEGQSIYINVANGSGDGEFDPAVALYYYSGGTATLVIENDDESVTPANPLGYDRTSRIAYTVPPGEGGEYYVCMSNWVDAGTNFPSDPLTPGTGPGLPGGRAGAYQIVIGLDMTAPVPDFLGGVKSYPVPELVTRKVALTPRYTGSLVIRNSGTSDYVITGYNVTGTDAAKFTVGGLTLPLTIAPDQSATVTVNFNSQGSQAAATAALDFTSNDPLDIKYPLTASGSPVTGGGYFNVRQAFGALVNNIPAADNVLAGNGATITASASPSFINYATGIQGYFPADVPFPVVGDNFAMQATGSFFIRTAGDYTFLINSDDGQRLRIDGNEVILNDAPQGPTDRFATVTLTAGLHTVEYTMFDSGTGDAAEVGIAQVQGVFTDRSLAIFELLEIYSADSDSDGLPDAWEFAYFPGDLSKLAAAPADFDNDGLTDVQELDRGTIPNDDDSDNDGLKDNVETGTGAWVSTTSTGTDPRKADTDGDSLSDSVETNTGTYVSAANTGTNPNRPDTDSDGFKDGIEVNYGTNPASAASKPFSTGQTFLLAHWPFNNASNPAAANDVIAGIPGVNTGTYSADGGGRSGSAGDRSINYLGTTNTIVNADFMNLAAPGDAITISYWQKLNAMTASSAFWAQSVSLADRGIQAHTPWSDNNFYFDHGGCCVAGAQRINVASPLGDITQWHHIALVKNGTVKQIWVDGVLALDGTGTAPLPSDMSDLYIGSGVGVNFMNGAMDDFAVFAGGLTEDQITRLALGENPASILVVPVSSFFITNVTVNGANVSLTWNSTAGAQYVIQSAENAASGPWTSVQSNIASGGVTTTATITKPAGTRFFLRVGKQ